MPTDEHVTFGDRQFMEPLAWYLHSVLRSCPDDEKSAFDAKTLANDAVDLYVTITAELLIQHGGEATVTSISKASSLDAKDVRKHLRSLVKKGVFATPRTRFSDDDVFVRTTSPDDFLGRQAAKRTMKLFAGFWGDDIEAELRKRYSRTTGRADNAFSESSLTPSKRRALGL